MLKTASLIVAGVMTLGYGTAALAQSHYDPTPEHIYYYGPAEAVANTAPTATTTAGRAAHAQAGHTTQNRHAQQHAMPAQHNPATQKPAPQG